MKREKGSGSRVQPPVAGVSRLAPIANPGFNRFFDCVCSILYNLTMKVTKIVPGRFTKQYSTVFLGENCMLKLHQDIIAKYQISDASDITDELFAEIKQAEELKEATEYSYLLLSYRTRSENEMIERLKRKKFSQGTITAVINAFKNSNLINDKDFAKNIAEDKIKSKMIGSERIREDMVRKGIDRQTAEDAVKNALENDSGEILDEDEKAYRALIKRRKQISETDFRTLHRKLFDYLSRRGFNYDTIEKALQRLKRDEKYGNEE